MKCEICAKEFSGVIGTFKMSVETVVATDGVEFKICTDCMSMLKSGCIFLRSALNLTGTRLTLKDFIESQGVDFDKEYKNIQKALSFM